MEDLRQCVAPGDAGEDPDDGEGCDCQTSASPPLWLLAVVALSLCRRRSVA